LGTELYTPYIGKFVSIYLTYIDWYGAPKGVLAKIKIYRLLCMQENVHTNAPLGAPFVFQYVKNGSLWLNRVKKA